MRDLAEEIRTARNWLNTGRALLFALRKEMLTKVSPAKLKRYLKSIGYSDSGAWGEGAEVWKDGCHAIIIPNSSAHEGYDEAILEVIEKLARWHRRKRLDVLHAIVRDEVQS